MMLSFTKKNACVLIKTTRVVFTFMHSQGTQPCNYMYSTEYTTGIWVKRDIT